MESTTKGVLLPRLTNAQRNAIVNPPAGLTIYNVDAKYQETFTGSIWKNAANLPNSGGTSIGSLKGAGSSCAPFSVRGIYYKGIPTNATNTAQVQVNVTTPGTYFIATSFINGIAFTGNGTFATTGVKNITLAASGTPSATGPYTYAINYAGTNCSFDVYFWDTTANLNSFSCTGPLDGRFKAGTAIGSGRTMTITVDVANPGYYAISTNFVNGYAFSSSGYFSTTGSQSLVLVASGTPIAAGTDNFTLKYGSSTYSCQFPVTVGP